MLFSTRPSEVHAEILNGETEREDQNQRCACLDNCDIAFGLNQDFIPPEPNFSPLLSFFFFFVAG